MEIVDRLLNRSEETAFRELKRIADDNDMRVFSKTRLSDVIVKGGAYLSQRKFDYFTRCHCDYVVTDADFRPLMVIEYDGPLHVDARQRERDAIKNDLCRRAGLGLLRINDRHVTKLYRGMSVLRWIIEVSELAKAFDKAQREGQVPNDEPFDPAAFDSFGAGTKRFPYWLSAPATQSFYDFFATLDPAAPHGWSSFVGYDAGDTAYRLSCLYFDDRVLWARTAVRRQDLDFPHFDLLCEIDGCELGERLAGFRRGEIRTASKAEFRPVFERFCERYDPHPSHSMGAFPFEGRWDPKNGWRSR
jgi:very-short-patch-repair endonuclease